MASIALGIAGLASAGAGIFGATQASKAAGEQVSAEQQAIAEQQREFGITQANEAPFIAAGQTSLSSLMSGISNGTFGTPATPPPAFVAPTIAQAEQNPGFQFQLQQGEKALAQSSAAAGGAVSGGTLKAAETFGQNEGQSDYQQVYQNAMSGYQASLAGFGASLTANQQAENQLLAPVQIGAGSTSALATTGANAANSISSLMSNIGTAQAGGTVGAANAISSGVSGLGTSLTQAQLLKLFTGLTGSGSTAGDTGVTGYNVPDAGQYGGG